VFLEAATRLGFQRISRIERRIGAEYREARSIPATEAGQAPSMLFVGNSLLLEAVEYPGIQKAAGPEIRVQRFVIERTNYLDWYYGIRRLLNEGSHPDFIVLCLAPSQMAHKLIRGEYSSYYLFQASDIPAVARDEEYGLTAESSLFAAHYSLYFAGRANLRSFLLNRVDHSYSEILQNLGIGSIGAAPTGEIERIAELRLRTLTESIGNRTRLILLLPPTFMPGEPELRAAAEKAGVPFLTPVHTGEIPRSMFMDEFHVNAQGAEKFTTALTPQLKALVASRWRH